MEEINIITPGFSLEDVNCNSVTDIINTDIINTDIINTDIINDNTDYSFIIYICIVIFFGIIAMIVINLYNKKKHVSFQEPYNEYYSDV